MYYMLVWLLRVMIELRGTYRGISTFRYGRSISVSA